MEIDWGHPVWLAFGLLGQGAFFARFLVQWIVSERAGESVVPMSFWYLSVIGSVILLIYAIHRREPVFVLAYLPNAVVYLRNIALVRRQRKRLVPLGLDPAAEATPPPARAEAPPERRRPGLRRVGAAETGRAAQPRGPAAP